MRRSEIFTKTSKTVPAGEVAKNAQLLIKAGFIHKEMAGVYDYLPLGKIVLDKIMQIIREEMNAIGGQEISLTALQNPETWQKSGRWNDEIMDVWFKTKLQNNSELGLAPTHEEPITAMMKNFISSYKDLPIYAYQFQIKFRNELRSKSGLMRGREFWMKDLYSFSESYESQQEFYKKTISAYKKIYNRLGIGETTFLTFASGGSFSKYSHEFQTLSEVGEDKIFIHEAKKLAINEEVLNEEVLRDLGISRKDLVEKKAVEVGNIFTLGTKFSESLDLNFTDKNGVSRPVFMGSYGIGPSRVMGLIAENFADEKGLIWPENLAPAKIYLIGIGENGTNFAEKLYKKFCEKNISVIFDDRENARPGEKFADAELMGIPWRVVASDKTFAKNSVEVKSRTSDEIKILSEEEIFAKISDN